MPPPPPPTPTPPKERKQRHKQLKKKNHPEGAKNAKSRAPASENAIRLFCKIRKQRACHAKWTCSNSLVAADQNAFFCT